MRIEHLARYSSATDPVRCPECGSFHAICHYCGSLFPIGVTANCLRGAFGQPSYRDGVLPCKGMMKCNGCESPIAGSLTGVITRDGHAAFIPRSEHVPLQEYVRIMRGEESLPHPPSRCENCLIIFKQQLEILRAANVELPVTEHIVRKSLQRLSWADRDKLIVDRLEDVRERLARLTHQEDFVV